MRFGAALRQPGFGSGVGLTYTLTDLITGQLEICFHPNPTTHPPVSFPPPLFSLAFSQAGHLLCPINQCSLIRNLPSSILWMASHSKSQKLPHNCCSGIITS